MLRFGVGGRLGKSLRVIIRRWVGVRIVIGVRIITVRIVVRKPEVSADEDARTSVEMASAMNPTVAAREPSMPTREPSVATREPSVATREPPVATAISSMTTGSSTPPLSRCLIR